MGDLAVNSEARLWGPYKELERTINSAIQKKNPDAVHDLEVSLKLQKPNFISLLKNPPKNNLYRNAVKKSTTEGLPVQGEQTTQTFSSQFIEEAIIISDLFDMNEIAAVELLMTGERKQAEFPGLTRGLVAVLLYFDGQRSLVSGLRTLFQSREGRTWTLELTPDLANIVTQFTDQLIHKDNIINKILELISSMNLIKEMDRLQKDRAIGPPKHKKQVSNLYKEIHLILADCLFCLSSQQPFDKANTKRLIAYLRTATTSNADGTLDVVNLCLLVTLLYCFDLSALEMEDASDSVRNLPFMADASYVPEIHHEIKSEVPWATPGIKAVAQFAWGLALRQLSHYQTPADVNEICEEEELIIDLALDGNVFHYLKTCVVTVVEFHTEEFYMRRMHGLLTDFIAYMPLKVKELRNKNEENTRLVMSQTLDMIDTSVSPNKGFEYLMQLIGDLYCKDPQGLRLSNDYWCPPETPTLHESMFHYRPPQKQVALYKFVRLAGDLLPASLYLPYIHMLTGLSSNSQAAHHCFDLLKTNGIGSGPATSVSWNHIFNSLSQYYSELRREAPTSADASHHQRAPHIRSITAMELEGLIAVLKLTRTIAEQNDICRVYLYENQQWSTVVVLFGLVTCSIPPPLKAELFLNLAAFAKSSEIAAALWQTLEASQILPTIQSSQKGGIQIELDEIESRNEEYPMLRGFLELMNALTNVPVPAGLGAGLRAPGFDPYLFFLRDNVFLMFNSRAYKKPEEKWNIASSVLDILSKLLQEHEITAEDFTDDVVELQSGGTTVVNKPPGHTLMVYMMNDSYFLKMILRILDEAIKQFETYTDMPGKEALERTALLCLRMIEYTMEKADQFVGICRESSTSIMVVPMDKLLLGINPRTGKPDHLVNIAKYITFSTFLPHHAQSAMTILYRVCRSAPVQTELLNLFTVDEGTKLDLLHGFVECLEVDQVEQIIPDEMLYVDEHEIDQNDMGLVKNKTRQTLLQIMLHSIEQPAPNLAHLLLGFELRKPVSKTNLQDPGILGAPKTCLHSILTMLDQGVGSPSGPSCLQETPQLAELSYKLIYMLCSNKDTAASTLRYLRTTRDFLYRQLQHLPYTDALYAYPVVSHQSWLLKTVAVELRMTSLNRQRSYTQRLMRLLLDDHVDEDIVNLGGGDEDAGLYDRLGESSMYQMALGRQNKQLRGKQTRRKLLCLLDNVDFTEQYPEPLTLEVFEAAKMEKVIHTTETRGENGVMYSNVKRLHNILMSELNNYHGTVVAAQRPRFIEELKGVLRNVVARNKVRHNLYLKQQSFDAWRQVAEILLTACPEDILTKDNRQSIIFELLHDLIQKVSDETALTELTAPVAGTLLTLTANLRLCFATENSSDNSTHRQYTQLQDSTSTLGQSVAWGEGSGTGSRTLYATSLQLVLKGLIDHIMRSSGGLQRVRANLYGSLLYYLQIAQKPKASPDSTDADKDLGSVGSKILAATDTEYEQLSKENMATILSYGDSFMDTVCRDACDGHDVGRMLALSVMDTILSMDKFQQWLTFMSSKGYLQHLVDSILHDDSQLQTLMSANPELRILYINESKMSLLTRVAESAVGAHTLLRSGLMQRLAACSFFDMRPEVERTREMPGFIEAEDFIPSPMARYQNVLFASLKLCLAVLTSLGIENQDAGTQVLQFIFAHGEVFHNILRDRQPSLNLQALRELSLTTAVIARANYRGIPDAEFDDIETAGIEFRGHRMRIERQMIALLPKYCLSEKLTKQLRNLENRELQEGRDLKAEVSLAYQEIAANVTSFCRAVVSTSGYSSQFCRVMFGTSLEEALARDIRNADEFSMSSISPSQPPNLGIIVYQLRQCANHFMSVYDTHQTHLRKLQSLSDLSTDDLKEYSGLSTTEKVPSHQRQHLARKRLSQIVHYKGRELKYLAYIIENCIFILWRHLEFYLLHCVPVDQQSPLYQSQVKRQQQMRRLQEISGASQMSYNDSFRGGMSDGEDLTRGVTRDEIDSLKQTAASAISEPLLKKLQEINQSFCKNRTHFGFVEALIRRVKRLLRLHTGS